MSKIGNYVLDKEHKGELIYDDYRRDYVTPKVFTLRTEVAYLEWEIQSLENDLKDKKQQLKEGEIKDEM